VNIYPSFFSKQRKFAERSKLFFDARMHFKRESHWRLCVDTGAVFFSISLERAYAFPRVPDAVTTLLLLLGMARPASVAA
jgi:hypothetical protein